MHVKIGHAIDHQFQFSLLIDSPVSGEAAEPVAAAKPPPLIATTGSSRPPPTAARKCPHCEAGGFKDLKRLSKHVRSIHKRLYECTKCNIAPR